MLLTVVDVVEYVLRSSRSCAFAGKAEDPDLRGEVTLRSDKSVAATVYVSDATSTALAVSAVRRRQYDSTCRWVLS